MDEEMTENKDIYVIPHNYTDNGKILGIIEKESMYAALPWFAATSLANFLLLPVSADVKLFSFILFVAPTTLFILIGVGGDTLLNFLRYLRKFYKRARIYCYEK